MRSLAPHRLLAAYRPLEITTSAQITTQCEFFKLPPGLRNEVYSYLFTPTLIQLPVSYGSWLYARHCHDQALTQTCRALRHETLPLYHCTKTYDLHYSLYHRDAHQVEISQGISRCFQQLDRMAVANLKTLVFHFWTEYGDGCCPNFTRLHIDVDHQTNRVSVTRKLIGEAHKQDYKHCVETADIEALVEDIFESEQASRVTAEKFLSFQQGMVALLTKAKSVA